MAKARPLLSQGQSDSDLVEKADSANWQEAGFTLPNLLALLATACVSSRLMFWKCRPLRFSEAQLLPQYSGSKNITLPLKLL